MSNWIGSVTYRSLKPFNCVQIKVLVLNSNTWSSLWVECSPMAQETGVQSQVESYQRIKKMILDTSLLIRYVSRVRWSNLGKGVGPPLHLVVVATEKGAFRSPFTTVPNFTYFLFLLNKNAWIHLTVKKNWIIGIP